MPCIYACRLSPLIGRIFVRRSQYREREAWSISRQQGLFKRQLFGRSSSSPNTPIAIKPGSCARAIVLVGLTPAGALHARRAPAKRTDLFCRVPIPLLFCGV